MSLHVGILIKATDSLAGTAFEKAIIFISAYNDEGAVGFVVNKLFPRTLNELQEFAASAAFPLHDGGPVDREHLFFIHRRPQEITGGKHITGDMYDGGNFKQAVQCINDRIIVPNDILVFVGYCGWDTGELDAELAEGSWQIVHADADPFVYAG